MFGLEMKRKPLGGLRSECLQRSSSVKISMAFHLLPKAARAIFPRRVFWKLFLAFRASVLINNKYLYTWWGGGTVVESATAWHVFTVSTVSKVTHEHVLVKIFLIMNKFPRMFLTIRSEKYKYSGRMCWKTSCCSPLSTAYRHKAIKHK